MTHQEILTALRTLQQQRKKYSDFHAAELHIHTPASSDYKLKQDKFLKNASLDEVVALAVEHKLLSPEQKELIKELEELNKDIIVYELIAKRLYDLNIRIAIVSDHNTIEGYDFLDKAVKEVKTKFNYNYHIDIFPGIEITCNDKTHIIGIFNHSPASISLVKKELDKLDLDEEGTTKDPSYVIEILKKAKGIVYIAHYDTSESISTWSHKFQRKIFSDENLDAIALRQCTDEKVDYYTNRFQTELLNRTNNLIFIKDGDSHCVEEIGINNIWIKCGSVNFTNLRHAFDDKPTRISLEKPKSNISTIIGMCILSGEKGFLGNKDNKHELLLVPFSSDLNTIIGGKGTGKTTLLNLLEWAFSQQCKNTKEFSFLLQFDEIHVFIYTENNYYVISVKPIKIWDEYSQTWQPDFQGLNNSRRPNNNYSIRGWVSIRRIIKNQRGNSLKLIGKEKEFSVINSIYKRIYSLSSIIHTVENGNFSEFIKNILNTNSIFIDNKIRFIINRLKFLNGQELEQNIKELNGLIEELIRLDDIIIEQLNKQAIRKLSLKRNSKLENLDHIILDRIPRLTSLNSNHYNEFLMDVLFNLLEKIDFLMLINKLFLDDIQSIVELVDWVLVTPEKGQKQIEKEMDFSPSVAILNLKKVLLENIIYDCIDAYIRDKTGSYNLEFNVNYKEGDKGTNFKDITELSQGQKGIAILTFIFEITTLMGDATPLILDQPEDHLDNLYIYKSLITDLRKIKNKKQVIVVTHNPSIVMAGDAEQVLAMGSNGRIGWLEKQGASDTESIVKFILGLMEGGRDCLELRLKKYNYKFFNLSNEFV